MFVRLTHWKVADVVAATAQLDEMEAKIKEIPGINGAQMIWTDDGCGVTIATYPSEAVADRAAGQVQTIWAAVASLLTEPPQIKSYSNVRSIV